jgi:hypothetical protein
MPNWCTNTLNVSGPESEVQRFKLKANGPTQSYNDFFAGSKRGWPIHDDIRIKAKVKLLPEEGEPAILSFHALFPVPEDFRRFPYDDARARQIGEAVGEERKSGGYGWEQANWGIKWGATDTELHEDQGTFLQYSFSTPWGPPEEFFNKISEDFPELQFELKYEEGGMGFAGEIVWDNGEQSTNEDWEIEWDEEEEEYERKD